VAVSVGVGVSVVGLYNTLSLLSCEAPMRQFEYINLQHQKKKKKKKKNCC
jgi:hypothetical protein